MRWIVMIAFWLPSAAFAAEVELTVQLPEGVVLKDATANSTETKLSTAGKFEAKAHRVTFENLLPDTPYDLTLTLSDGTILQGVNMNWYGMDAAKAGAGPLDDDDRKVIGAIVNDPRAFENKRAILFTEGDNTRVTMLVELIRDKDFHAGEGNIIWRVELWYFENQFGGWAKVVQQNKVLRRERFKDQAAFDAAVGKIKWVRELGGVKLSKDKPAAEITLPSAVLSPPAPAKTPTAK
jgi:hypothetical protein